MLDTTDTRPTGGRRLAMAGTMSPLWRVNDQGTVGDGPSWLCPSDLDRRRLIEMEGRLLMPRFISYLCVIGALVAVQPMSTPWIFVLAVISFGNYKLATKGLSGRTRPEYAIAYAASVTQLCFAAGVAMSGGPHSPLMGLLVIPFVSFSARFTTRGTIAGVVLTVLVLLAATLGVDPRETLESPTLLLATMAAFIGIASFAVAFMNADVEMRQDATRDPLTGLHNRKALRVRFDELCTHAEHAGTQVAVVMLDIDHFKSVNDTYGHPRGDAVLQAVADTLRAGLREGELVYRLGGEEFLVLLSGDSATQAEAIGDRLRAAVAEASPAGLPITVSVGVSIGADAADYATLFERADAALYDAKRLGRDRVVAHNARSTCLTP
jgi:diguanylate cyclase (GGDEF)-like protein